MNATEGALRFDPDEFCLTWSNAERRVSVRLIPELLRALSESPSAPLALFGQFRDKGSRTWVVSGFSSPSDSDRDRPDLIGLVAAKRSGLPIIRRPSGQSPESLLLITTDEESASLELWNPASGERAALVRFFIRLGDPRRAGFHPFRVEPVARTEQPETEEPLDQNAGSKHAAAFRIPIALSIVVLLVAAGLTGLYFSTRTRDVSNSAPAVAATAGRVAFGFGMYAEKAETGMEIRWDAGLSSFRRARTGVLKVADGGQLVAIPLTSSDLARGSITYMPRSDALGIELSVDTGNGMMSERISVAIPRQAPPVPQAQHPEQPARSVIAREPQVTKSRAGITEAKLPVRIPDRAPEPPRTAERTEVAAAPEKPLSGQPAAMTAQVPALRRESSVPTGSRETGVPAATAPQVPIAKRTPDSAAVLRRMDVVAPVPVKQVSPILPELLRRTLAGPVDIDVTFEVDEKGAVTSASSPQSSGISEHLARFAVAAARAWKFRPALRNSQPVRSSYTARFSFQRSR